MKHIRIIQALVKTLLASDNFHALILESQPGTGKSTTVDLALKALSVKAVSMGSYATPLHIYNMICQHSSSVLLLDDCHGALNDPKVMSLLKAATWQAEEGGGSKSPGQSRRVSWGSTSEKVEETYCDFSGKLILLTNAIPSGKETEAFLSRCLSYRIEFSEMEIRKMIARGAKSRKYLPDGCLAKKTSEFLLDPRNRIDFTRVNLRTLRLGYDLAVTHPDSWQELFLKLLPRKKNGKVVDKQIKEIFDSGLKAKEEEARFRRLTGKSRRTYYLYKRQLGLSRSYGIHAE